MLSTRPPLTYSLHLLQHSVFDFDVFKNRFNDHVGFLKTTVVQLARKVGQDGVSLERCDPLLFGFVIEPGYKFNTFMATLSQKKKEKKTLYWSENAFDDSPFVHLLVSSGQAFHGCVLENCVQSFVNTHLGNTGSHQTCSQDGQSSEYKEKKKEKGDQQEQTKNVRNVNLCHA